MRRGTLYLVPVTLGGSEVTALLAPLTLTIVRRTRHFIAENPKSARAFLKAAQHPGPLQDLHIETLDEHTPPSRVAALLHPIEDGFDCGVLSEAGCPGVADPGALVVRAAHERGISVVPLVGPSSLLLALMASGLNGQHFVFHGYVPVERSARERKLAELEAESARRDATQIFIEAPYRNDALFEAIAKACRPDTLLCIATDLTLATESVRTRTLAQWKSDPPGLARRPTVFLLYRRPSG
jgi:16S rRNA (cytidine1402-2'-O)-methyltransferase